MNKTILIFWCQMILSVFLIPNMSQHHYYTALLNYNTLKQCNVSIHRFLYRTLSLYLYLLSQISAKVRNVLNGMRLFSQNNYHGGTKNNLTVIRQI